VAGESRDDASAGVVRPVSKDSPTGEWIRYEAEFEGLKAQIDGLSGVDPSTVDWRQVVSLSSDILEKRSKDILVASYLASGLFERDGFRGLEEGLAALVQMTSTYWDGLFPEMKRARARASAVAWLVERLTEVVEPEQTRPADREALEGCIRQTEALAQFLDEKMGDKAPALGPLRRTLEKAVEELDRREAAPAPAPAEETVRVEKAAERTLKTTSEPLDLSSPEQAERALGRTLSSLKKIGRLLRQKDPRDPRAYQLARIVAWLPMTQVPNHTDGQTQFSPSGASQSLVESYLALAAKGEWSKLLEQAESQFERSVLWLDVQRFIAMALAELGSDYERAKQVVVGELTTLIRRFPEVVDLRFSNDTEFAAEETRAWIASSVLAGSEEAADLLPATTAPAAGSGEDEALQEALEEAGKLVRKRKLSRAVATLGQLVDVSGDRRRRFLRRLALARFLADARQHQLAISQLECLDEEVRRFGLEQWEPALSLEVLQLYLGCQNTMLSGEWKSLSEAAGKARELYSRLARIDAGVALGLK
jgi:type VI secretion system protein VasJ